MWDDAETRAVSRASTDYATQERQVRARDEKEGVERWLEDVFFALGEVTFLALPALFSLMDAEPNVPLKYAAMFVWATLVLATGTMRDDRFGGRWPPVSPVLVAVRFVYYNAVVLAGAYGGAAVDLSLGSPVVTAAVATLVALAAAAGFPRLVAALGAGPSNR